MADFRFYHQARALPSTIPAACGTLRYVEGETNVLSLCLTHSNCKLYSMSCFLLSCRSPTLPTTMAHRPGSRRAVTGRTHTIPRCFISLRLPLSLSKYLPSSFAVILKNLTFFSSIFYFPLDFLFVALGLSKRRFSPWTLPLCLLRLQCGQRL